jgi:hypothetical protein
MPERPPHEYTRGRPGPNPLRRIWRFVTQESREEREAKYFEAYLTALLKEANQPTDLEIILSAKIDALTAAVVALEATAVKSATETAAAVQLFKDNAAASIELAADDTAIADLTNRVAAAQSTINADTAALAAASAPAPVAPAAPPAA